MNIDPFEVLQVPQNASIDEIIRARRQLARIFHPDVSEMGPETEETMKNINLAFDILTDPTKRQKYLDHRDNESGQEFEHSRPSVSSERLTGYEFRSKEFFELFETYLKNPKPPIGKSVPKMSHMYKSLFKAEIDASYEDYVNKTENRHLDTRFDLAKIFAMVERFFYIKDDVEETLSRSVMNNDTTVQDIVFSNRNSNIKVSMIKASVNEQIAIVNLNSFRFEQLRDMLFIVEPKQAVEISKKNMKEIIECLKKSLPNISIESDRHESESNECQKCQKRKTFFVSFYNCIACGERFCEKCLIKESARLPRLGFAKGRICQKCNDDNEKWEVTCWFDKSIEHLRNGMINKALFCFYASMALDKSSSEINEINKISIKWTEMIRNDNWRAILLFDILNRDIHPDQRGFYMKKLANSLQAMAEVESNDDAKYQLYVASLKVQFLNRSFKSKEIELLKENISTLAKKAAEQVHQPVVSSLAHLIDYTNLIEIFDLLIKNKSSLKVKFALRDYFFRTKEESMRDERTKSSYLFARGIYQIFYGLDHSEILEGFRFLEVGYWKSLNFSFGSSDLYVQVIVAALAHGITLPFETLFRLDDKQREAYLPNLLPQRSNLKPTYSILWSDISLRNKNLRPFKIYEKAIYHNDKHKIMSWTNLKSALSYIDLIDTCESIQEIVFCFIQAAAWSLDAIDSSDDPAEKFAHSRLLYKWIQTATYLSHMFLDTASKSCVFYFLFGLAYYANIFGLEEDNELVGKLFRFYLFGSVLLPISNLQLVLVSESAILACNLRELSTSYIKSMLNMSQFYQPAQTYVYKYAQFEIDQRSMGSREDPKSSDEIRVEAMNSFLEKHQIGWTDVVNFIDYPLVQRTKEGWMLQKLKLDLEKNDGQFSTFNGFTINKKTNELTILVETASNLIYNMFFEPKIAKFNWADVATILCNIKDASPSFFSLDPVDERIELHPFQKFDYKPDFLKGSNILHTLFHTDYLLKQFSMGIEVSCSPPFKQRNLDSTDAKSECLFMELPEHLRHVLRSTDKRGQRGAKVSRMWIQADELEYEIVDNEDELKFLFGNLKMSVRTHPMVPNNEGKLVDTDTNPDKDSAEYQFAKDLSDNYDDMSKYFPEFGRLKEICKLQYLGIFINSYRESFDNNMNANLDQSRLNKIYNDMHERIRQNIDEGLQKTVSNLKSENISLTENVCDSICSALNCNLSRNMIKSWLQEELSYFSSSAYTKRNEIAKKVADNKTTPIAKMKEEIENHFKKNKFAFEQALEAQVNLLRPIYESSISEWPKDKVEWVPALIKQMNEEFRFIYGGVVLCPTRIEKTNLEKKQGKSEILKVNSKTLSDAGKNRRNNSNRVFSSSSSQPPPTTPPPSEFLVQPESNEPPRNYLMDFIRYKNKLEELFPGEKQKEKFKEQLRNLVAFVNKCRKDFKEEQPFQFTPYKTYKDAEKAYNHAMRKKLRKEWSEFFGIEWPKDENGAYYELHHIIPLEFGGSNELWNIIPVKRQDHRGKNVGLHYNELKEIDDVLRSLCKEAYPNYK